MSKEEARIIVIELMEYLKSVLPNKTNANAIKILLDEENKYREEITSILKNQYYKIDSDCRDRLWDLVRNEEV